ncbi:MBOAT family O-acyltransferase [Luteimonas lutimaris]|uniref:Probable alginate O-acetylase n=1 Tax=Luteimonas lutimaris TaxID=698645 RepID=A0ABP7MWT1_9GAMM
MIFSSATFLVFFTIVFALFWGLRSHRARIWLLLVASQVFYGWWDYRFLALMWFAIATCHFAGRLIDRNVAPKAVTTVAVVLMLGVLAVFKYFNFFTDSLVGLATSVGIVVSRPTLEILLPVGISFFTFQALSYVLDVRKGSVQAERSIVNTGLYISFFPQLVAGPIVRASDFLPQLREPKVFNGEQFLVGMKLFLVGFIYKSVFSDSISPFVDQVYGDLDAFDAHSKVMATVGFYGQIYFDFAGYSMMGIGVARMLGFELMRNFAYPYISTSITEFWRRWHISLSTWLRDYLYIPLGGNRDGELKRQRNLMITMLLGGLWHGASWNFVLWGALHGMALSIHKAWAGATKNIRRPVVVAAIWGLAAWGLTQLFVLLTWVPFRAQDFAGTLDVLGAFIGRDDGGTRASIPYIAVLLPLFVDTALVGISSARFRLAGRLPALGPVTAALALGGVAAVALAGMPLAVKNFIYFQF